jgi:hypothetical protein
MKILLVSVVDPKLFYPDPTLTLIPDPDSNPDPACLLKIHVPTELKFKYRSLFQELFSLGNFFYLARLKVAVYEVN